jgi:hypothetical protein
MNLKPEFKVLVTGSRDWEEYQAVASVLDEIKEECDTAGMAMVVIHGKARGADSCADHWCEQNGLKPRR